MKQKKFPKKKVKSTQLYKNVTYDLVENGYNCLKI